MRLRRRGDMRPGRRRAEKMILQSQVTLQKAVRFYHTIVVIERRPGVMTAQPGAGEVEARGEFILRPSPGTKDNDSKCTEKKKKKKNPETSLHSALFLAYTIMSSFYSVPP